MDRREEIYIINRDSGQTLFFQSFSQLDHDADLFAGLFTAILQFASAYSKYQIGDFQMKSLDIFIFQGDYPLIYVYIIDKKRVNKKNRKDITRILNYIKTEFEKNYTLEDITTWNGNLTKFKPFAHKLDPILHPWNEFKSLF